MKFKLDFDVKMIESPVVLITDEHEYHFENSDALANQEFEKKYEIVSIKAVDGVIQAKAKEKSLLPTEDWTKKEVSFF